MRFNGCTECLNRRNETKGAERIFQTVRSENVTERRLEEERMKGTCRICLSEELVYYVSYVLLGESRRSAK